MKTSPLLILPFLLLPATSQALTIVDLSEATARFDSLTDNDGGIGGFAAGNPPAAENNLGLTFNATFTPAAGDLDSTTAAVSLIEIGGDANGTGLYLLGGELHFISKMNSAAGQNISAFDDLNWNTGANIGVQSTFGPLVAGTEYAVAAIFDPITTGTLRMAVYPIGGSTVIDEFSFVNRSGRTNWSGDDSATAFRGGNVGNFGGATIASGATWSEAKINSNPFEGTQGQALYWSGKQASFTVPDASTSLSLFGIGLVANFLGLTWYRRGRKTVAS